MGMGIDQPGNQDMLIQFHSGSILKPGLDGIHRAHIQDATLTDGHSMAFEDTVAVIDRDQPARNEYLISFFHETGIVGEGGF